MQPYQSYCDTSSPKYAPASSCIYIMSVWITFLCFCSKTFLRSTCKSFLKRSFYAAFSRSWLSFVYLSSKIAPPVGTFNRTPLSTRHKQRVDSTPALIVAMRNTNDVFFVWDCCYLVAWSRHLNTSLFTRRGRLVFGINTRLRKTATNMFPTMRRETCALTNSLMLAAILRNRSNEWIN